MRPKGNQGESKISKSPIFIVGTPRSGTTLLAKALGQHSRIFMPGETHFFDDIFSRRNQIGSIKETQAFEKVFARLLSLYSRYNEPHDQARIDEIFRNTEVRKKMQESCKNYADILSFFMEIQTQYEGKNRWGNNTPRDIFNIDHVISFYPDAKVIVCIRDIRDYLLSYKYKWRVTALENIQRVKHMYHPVMTSLLWKYTIRQLPRIKLLVPERNLLLVRYEYLVSQPDNAFKQIFNFIEEQFEPSVLDIDYDNSSFRGQDRGIFASSIGRWEKGLTPAEVLIAQMIGGQEFLSVGYEKDRPKYSIFVVLGFFLSTPLGFLRAVNASRSMRGPLIPYLRKRLFSNINGR